jgi:hypothetical protein
MTVSQQTINMTTIFNCADCRKAIKENSREHDDCWTNIEKDDDLWYCADCKCDHMPNDDDFDEEPFFKTEEEDDEDDAELIIPQAHNIGEFYTEEEQKKIFEALKAKFEAERREILEEGRRLLIKDGEKEVDGTCNMCGVKGKYIADADDDGEWTCLKCAGMGWGSDSEEEDEEETTDLPPSFKGACADCGQIETECSLKLVGEKVMCCDCIDPENQKNEEEFSCGNCPDCGNEYTDAQIESGEVVPCNRCYKCFVGDCGKTNCDCDDTEEEDEESVCDDEQRSYGARGAPAPESDDED